MNVNGMIYLLDKTIKNILYNFLPLEKITCGDKNPLCIDMSISRLIQEKN